MTRIVDVRSETPSHKTFVLDTEVEAVPGQFCMPWIPRLDEKPMSLSNIDGKAWVTVKKVGRFTQKMFELKKGDKIGFRGPYGCGFESVKGSVCIVGGGCGIAPLRPLKDMLSGHVIISARTKSELMFAKDFKDAGFEVHLATDDGSEGVKAFAHEVLSELLQKNKFKSVYSCGPEIMMKKIADICGDKGVPAQLSLERYMKCGVGICGACSIAGLRVCKDGPVFTGEELSETEFGKYTKDASGSKRTI